MALPRLSPRPGQLRSFRPLPPAPKAPPGAPLHSGPGDLGLIHPSGRPLRLTATRHELRVAPALALRRDLHASDLDSSLGLTPWAALVWLSAVVLVTTVPPCRGCCAADLWSPPGFPRFCAADAFRWNLYASGLASKLGLPHQVARRGLVLAGRQYTTATPASATTTTTPPAQVNSFVTSPRADERHQNYLVMMQWSKCPRC